MYDKYLETEVFSADPVKRVCMLYRAAIEAVGAARRHLLAGAIRERSRQISKTMEILIELSRSLDHGQGGDLSRSLADLYAYIQGRLIEANARQIDVPLAEVEQLLGTLLTAWSALPAASKAPAGAYQQETEYIPMSCSG